MYYLYLDENGFIERSVFSTTNISKENVIEVDIETYNKKILPLFETYEKVKYEDGKFIGVNKKPEIYNYEPTVNIRLLYTNYERNVLHIVTNIIELIRSDIDKSNLLNVIKTNLPRKDLSYLDQYKSDKELYAYALTLSIQYHIYDIILHKANYDHETISKQLKERLYSILEINLGG